MTAAMERRQRLAPSARAGYTLVEVIVAMLISCIMVTAVMGVAVTSKEGSGKAMHHLMFNQGIAQLSAEVKQYVTACGCTKAGACPAPNCTEVLGPNTNNAGVGTWYLNGAPGAAGNLVDSMGNVWALACGAHTITGVVPTLEAAPYNGSITYTVSYPVSGTCAGTPTATDAPAVSFAANWTEP
ncbi:MAG TPA: prepilin-type N-terminal cleavage/methylation domain-containing protein [Elusimicrobiota bacterium]|jgi:prepilin-type N-terminal cleavage/methylation domain-containing protein|nr:prepilin-type N-terminal cleavage/methylation domain-containing protein [Elusimicrobiota bacterium]